MESGKPQGDLDVQRQLGKLADQVADNRAVIDALQIRAEATDSRAAETHLRVTALEGRADVDREMIRALEAEGLLQREQAENLQEALASARTIGAAVGIIMWDRKVAEAEAFTALVRSSQNTNRKLRLIAREIVDTGDLTQLRVL